MERTTAAWAKRLLMMFVEDDLKPMVENAIDRVYEAGKQAAIDELIAELVANHN